VEGCVLDRETIDRLRLVDTGGAPVVSIYLGLDSDLGELRAIPARLKGLVAPLRELADSGRLGPERSKRLRDDLSMAMDMAERARADLGRGVAIFVGGAAGLREHVSLPVAVRDRAVADTSPYLGPLEAVLAHFHRYCAVVVGRRSVSIYRFFMGTLESWEELAAEEGGKDNYGGFQGYDEQRSRSRAEVAARRFFRGISDRVGALTGEFDLLVVGGNQANVDGLVAELGQSLRDRLAGTFTVDPGTTSPSEVRDWCRSLAAAYELEQDAALVADVTDAAASGDRAVIGLDRVLDAVNQRAVDLLLVAVDETIPGVCCVDCGWLMRTGSLCAACGEGTRPAADLVDSAAEATRASGGRVRYLIGPARPDRFRLAATVRFPVPSMRSGD
jgi:peptide chain release factor subunit 1